MTDLLGLDLSTPPTHDSFKNAIEGAQDSHLQSKWILADIYTFSDDNPEYGAIYEQYADDNKVSESSIKKYRNTVRTFPYARRIHNLSIEMYYTVQTLETHQQDALLSRVTHEGLTRQDLRDEVKRIKAEPITETTILELPVIEIDGNRYVIADDVPTDIEIVTVKFKRVIAEGLAA